MNPLLKLKATHLFLLLILVTLLSEMEIFGNVIKFIGLLFYISWMYSIGSYMNSFIPEKSRPSITYFQISCLFIVLFEIFTYLTIGYISDDELFQFNGYKSYLFILFGLYSAWSMLYIFSFAARMLESVIEGKITTLNKSIKGFFCFWFFPIGIWYIQPAVHRVIENHPNNANIANK